jgi:transcription initiation factor TFIIH subunit 2
MEVDDDEDDGGRQQYAWEGDARPQLASEAAVGSLRREGQMQFGGVMFTGTEATGEGTQVVRRGLARALVVAYDWGASMTQPEPAPLRSAFVLGQLTAFVGEYFAANPLSQLALISTAEGTATRVSALSAAPSSHVAALVAATTRECEGEVSLQHCVELAVAQLRHCASHVSREVLLVISALSTCDPGDLRAAAEAAKQARVRVSVLHLSAQVYAAEQVTRATGGIHAVMVDKHHFQQLLRAHVPPPIDHRPPGEAVALVATGFPLPSREGPVLCVCHRRMTETPLRCPRCLAAVCELPSNCPLCARSNC